LLIVSLDEVTVKIPNNGISLIASSELAKTVVIARLLSLALF